MGEKLVWVDGGFDVEDVSTNRNSAGDDGSLTAIEKVVKGATWIMGNTNFFGGQPKGPHERGLSANKYLEFEVISEEIIWAIRHQVPLHVSLVYEDFYSIPHLTLTRILFRCDAKYVYKGIDSIIDVASKEISDVLKACESLRMESELSSTVDFEFRLTKGKISSPVICSNKGATEGRQRGNLSDFNAPTDYYQADEGQYHALCDSNRVFQENSYVVIGKSPCPNANQILRLGLDENALASYLKRWLHKDFHAFPEYYQFDEPDDFHFEL